MPEGDTVHAVASYLAPRLEGLELVGGALRELPEVDLARRRVGRVRALGKHLFVELADGAVLRSHLGMRGAWHRYRPAEPWRLPRGRASLVLATERDVLVCFDAAEVELLRAGSAAERDALARVGPDLLAPEVDLAAVVRRARERAEPGREVAELLLDQRVAGGVGNVYKSEVLFLERLHPRAEAAALGDAALAGLWGRARDLLRANRAGGVRRTRPQDGRGDLWVYRRGGRPCLRCGAAVVRALLGRAPRSTYWCPACQPLPPARAREAGAESGDS